MASKMKSLHLFLAFCFALCVQMSLAAYQFRVGGPSGWVVPTGSETETYNQWAERNRFHVYDDLYFKYEKPEDSVLQVTQEAYETCNTSNPVATYDDGNTVIKLRHPGAFYFISGAPGNCNKGEKLIVVVMASPRASSPSPSGTNSTTDSSAPPSISFASVFFTSAFASIACLLAFWLGTFP